MQNSPLISQQDLLLTKLCSGPGYAPVLRGGLSAAEGIWLCYPKPEVGQRAINYTRGEKNASRLIVGCALLVTRAGAAVLYFSAGIALNRSV